MHSKCSFMSPVYVCDLKLQLHLWKTSYENRVYKTRYVQPFIYHGVHWQILRFIVFVHGWYTGRGIPARSIFPQLSPFLELSKARASEASVRPGGRRSFTSLGHSGRVIRVQPIRAMRGIFDVKVLLPSYFSFARRRSSKRVAFEIQLALRSLKQQLA